MVFTKYQHVGRIGSDETEGLLDGVCHVFPKMDGSNMCAYSEDGELRTMSRNRVVEPPEPFAVFARGHDGVRRFIGDFPGLRLYGEWMTPHTVKSYVPEVWNRWLVFDVVADDPDAVYGWSGGTLECGGRRYIPYEEYAPILEAYGIDIIPPLAVIDHPSVEELQVIADTGNTWMVSEGRGCGEGVVVKRYGFQNRFGHTVWAKVLNSAFCTFGRTDRESDGDPVEKQIADRYVTRDLVEKERSRIAAESYGKGGMEPRLLSTVYHCLLTECIWDAVKRFKSPTVDFKKLRAECERRTRELLPDVFDE